MRQGLPELAHEYTAMGVLSPIQLIGRRRVEYPLVQDTVTHDCHILLRRILPAGLRRIMDKDIYEAVAELGNFFRELCCKTLKLIVLERLEKEIPIILCKLEKIFPPAFFTVMVHLARQCLEALCNTVGCTQSKEGCLLVKCAKHGKT